MSVLEPNPFELPEGSLRLPLGWGGKVHCVFYQPGGDGRLVVSFGPKDGTLDTMLQEARGALADFQLLDRRRIQVDRQMGDYADIAFSAQARRIQQIVVVMENGPERSIMFQASVTGPMTGAARQAYLQAICSFQARQDR